MVLEHTFCGGTIFLGVKQGDEEFFSLIFRFKARQVPRSQLNLQNYNSFEFLLLVLNIRGFALSLFKVLLIFRSILIYALHVDPFENPPFYSGS